MVSKEFKEFAKVVKSLNIKDAPSNIQIDKNTGEPKPSAKNLQAFKLVDALLKLNDSEFTTLFRSRYKGGTEFDNAVAYLESVAGKEFNKNYLADVIYLAYEYRQKVEKIEARKEREAKKARIEAEKNKVILSLNRKDIAKAITGITKSMKPYIVKGEKNIQSTIKGKEKEFNKDWKDIQSAIKKDGYELIIPFGGRASLKATLLMGNLHKGDNKVSLKSYIRERFYRFYDNWFTKSGYELNTAATYIAEGRVDKLIEQLQKQFREGEEFKVELLFHRLLKKNPTLNNYTLSSPYNGNEFTLNAVNDKGETIVIQTNTITAGGYNIQRLHTRWLVDIRNTVSGKSEKFKIDNTDVKKGK